MDITIRDDNKIENYMIEQLREGIEWLGEEIEKSVSSSSNKTIIYF